VALQTLNFGKTGLCAYLISKQIAEEQML